MTERIKVDLNVLCTAVKNGFLTIVKDLLKDGTDVNVINDSDEFKGMSPLHVAVYWRQVEIAELLINYGADVNVKDNKGHAPIVYALLYMNAEIIELFLRNGADTKEDSTVLCAAIKIQYLPIVVDLLKNGADVNVINDSDEFQGMTPLHIAVRRNQVEIAKLLIKYGANVNVEDRYGDTPIVYAIENKNTKLYELFVRNGANVKEDPRALRTAIRFGNQGIVVDLLKNGADVNMIYYSDMFQGMTPLHIAVHRCSVEMAKLLINYGANSNAKDSNGDTPLVYAIRNAHTDMIELLVTKGADIKEHNLCAAVACGCVKLVKDLLDNDADVNMIDNSNVFQGMTPLHTAVFCNQEQIAKLLLYYGANVNVKNTDGDTPIVYALLMKNTEMVDLLLCNGADTIEDPRILCTAVKTGNLEIIVNLLTDGVDVNMISNSNMFKGLTPLHTAVRSYQINIAKLLIKYGANVNVKDNKGVAPIDDAIQNEETDMIELLLINGADITENHHLLRSAVAYGCLKVVEDVLRDGADVNMIDGIDFIASHTPLHTAIHWNQVEMAKLLIKYGANVNVKPYNGDTPIDDAINNGDTEMTELLLINGATIREDLSSLCKDSPITKLLKQHIAKVKAAGLYVSEKNLLWISNDYKIDDFLNECQAEIEFMKSKTIDNSCVSFYDILTKDTSQLANNESIMQVLKSDDYKRKFPIYSSMIDSRFRRELERKEILEQVRIKFLDSVFKSLPKLPLLCTEKIINNLSYRDLSNLLRYL